AGSVFVPAVKFASFDGSGIEFRAEVFVVLAKRLGNGRFLRVAVALLAVLLCTLTSAMLAQDTSTTPAAPLTPAQQRAQARAAAVAQRKEQIQERAQARAQAKQGATPSAAQPAVSPAASRTSSPTTASPA